MEKIIIQPQNVRCLGNIVSPKDKDNFLGGKIVKGTATVNGQSNTVYTGSYLADAYLTITGNHYIGTEDTLTLNCTLRNSQNTLLTNSSVYCDVEGTVYNGRTNNSGVCTFELEDLAPGRHRIKVYYPGSSTNGSCFKFHTVFVGDEDLSLSLYGTNDLIQTDGFTELFTALNPALIGEKVYFFEAFTPTLLTLQGTESIIQTSDTVDLEATLKDDDGSLVKGRTVHFFEAYTPTLLKLTGNKNIMQTGNSLDIQATLKDTDGSLMKDRTVHFFIKED